MLRPGIVARPVSDRYFRRCASTHRFRRTQASKLRGDLAPPATGLSPARKSVLSWAREIKKIPNQSG